MTLEQVGAYSFLLANCWDSDDCSLPDDEAALANLSRMNERWFTDASKLVRVCFTPHPRHKGALTNKRLYGEYQTLRRYQHRQQISGKIGGIRSGVTRRQHIGIEAEMKQPLDLSSSETQAKRSSSSSSSSSSSIKSKKRNPLISPLKEQPGDKSGTGLERISEGLKKFFQDKMPPVQEPAT